MLAKLRGRGQSIAMPMSPLTRLRWRRRLRTLAAILLLGGLALATAIWRTGPPLVAPLVHIIDGDSLTVRQDGAPMTIRLTGLDAVEYRQDCVRSDGGTWPCGHEARRALEKLAGSEPLHCDIAAKYRYGRTLASCRTRPFPEGLDLGGEMVRLGWAVATDDAYPVEEAAAQAARRGIWQGSFTRPADWRAAHQRSASALTPPDN